MFSTPPAPPTSVQVYPIPLIYIPSGRGDQCVAAGSGRLCLWGRFGAPFPSLASSWASLPPVQFCHLFSPLLCCFLRRSPLEEGCTDSFHGPPAFVVRAFFFCGLRVRGNGEALDVVRPYGIPVPLLPLSPFPFSPFLFSGGRPTLPGRGVHFLGSIPQYIYTITMCFVKQTVKVYSIGKKGLAGGG